MQHRLSQQNTLGLLRTCPDFAAQPLLVSVHTRISTHKNLKGWSSPRAFAIVLRDSRRLTSRSFACILQLMKAVPSPLQANIDAGLSNPDQQGSGDLETDFACMVHLGNGGYHPCSLHFSRCSKLLDPRLMKRAYIIRCKGRARIAAESLRDQSKTENADEELLVFSLQIT